MIFCKNFFIYCFLFLFNISLSFYCLGVPEDDFQNFINGITHHTPEEKEELEWVSNLTNNSPFVAKVVDSALGLAVKAQEVKINKEKIEVETEAKLKLNEQKFKFEERELDKTRKTRLENALTESKYAIDAKWNFLKDPKMVGLYVSGVSGVVIIGFAAKNGFPIAKKWIEKKLFKPVLVLDTSNDKKSRTKMKAFTSNNIILNQDIKSEFSDLIKSTQSAISLGIPFEHVLFYGPPGTGKTLAAKTIANEAAMDYDIIAGSSFDQFSKEEALQELQHIFAWAKKERKGKKGRIIFIDEADSLLKKRDGSDIRSTQLVNMFLSYVPEPHDPDLMFIFATNHPEKLDGAVLSRVGRTFEFQLPDVHNRKAMLSLEISKLEKNIKISPLVMDSIPTMAEKMVEFSGRDILTFVIQCRSAAVMRKDKTITKAIADTILTRLIKRKKAEVKMQKGTTGYFKSDDTSLSSSLAPES